MKKIIIISPHFPPSNLAAVHRSRLFAQHLPRFGWEPIILTVEEQYYEEQLDWDLVQLLPGKLRMVKVKALPVMKPRIIGDIALRGFFSLYRQAKQMIKTEKIDFLYIPIPSFYSALLGRWLHENTGIKYGIDYIDPWVHSFPGSEKIFSRHWWSMQIAKWLEPIAIKKASLITGVAEGYFQGVQDRNPHVANKCIFTAMPYGGEIADHIKVDELKITPYLFEKSENKIQIVYAGALLPKSFTLLDKIFQCIADHKELFAKAEFHFIGTGKWMNDAETNSIKPLAEKYSLWQKVVFEYPKRIPYLDVLAHLNHADGIFILGSTEPHYTPSKSYQAVLAHKPILAVLHQQSTAVKMLDGSNSAIVLPFNGEADLVNINQLFLQAFIKWLRFKELFTPAQINMDAFNRYSAEAVTKKLTDSLNCLV